MPITLEIPDSAVAGLDLPPDELRRELRRELAVALYARGTLPIGKALELAELPRQEFDRLLGVRQVRRPFDQQELERELS